VYIDSLGVGGGVSVSVPVSVTSPVSVSLSVASRLGEAGSVRDTLEPVRLLVAAKVFVALVSELVEDFVQTNVRDGVGSVFVTLSSAVAEGVAGERVISTDSETVRVSLSESVM
jgi:hypothetical protein